MSENPTRDLGIATIVAGVIGTILGFGCAIIAIWQTTHPSPDTAGAWAGTAFALMFGGIIVTLIGWTMTT